MATVHRRDPRTGEWVAIDISLSPSGVPGPTGPTGSTRVSLATGNAATIDPSGIYVPVVETQPAADLLYVHAAGGTMTGALRLPDPAYNPPSVPAAAAAVGYVDELSTVSAAEPFSAPTRDGMMWTVMAERPLVPPTNVVGTWVDMSTNTLTWVDSIDPEATGYEVFYSMGTTMQSRMTENVPVTVPPGMQTLNHAKDAAAQTAGTLHYSIRAVSAASASDLVQIPVSLPPPTPPTAVTGTWTLPANTINWVDSTGIPATSYEAFYNVTGSPVHETDLPLGAVPPGTRTLVHTKTPDETTAGNVFYGVRALGVGGASGLAQLTVVNEGLPPGPTEFTGIWTSPTENRLVWTDSTDAAATYEVRYNLAGAIVGDGDILIQTGIAPGTGTLVHNQDAAAQAAPQISYGIKAIGVAGSSAWVPTVIDGPAESANPDRPPGWLPITIPRGSDSIQVLSLVPGNGGTIGFTVSGAYTVHWGDGTAAQDYAAAVTATHTYSHAALGSELPDGKRQAVALVTPQAGNTLNSFYFTDSLSLQPIGEVVFGSGGVTNAPASSLGDINRVLVEHIEYLSPTAMPNPVKAFARLNRLTRVTGPLDTSMATDFTGIFYLCHSLATVPALNSAAGQVFHSAFRETRATSVPTWNFAAGRDFTATFYNCPSLVSVSLNAPAATTLGWAFAACAALGTATVTSATATNLAYVFKDNGAMRSATLSTSKGTDFSYAFDNCVSLTSVSVNTTSATDIRFMFSNCRSLTRGPSMGTANVVNLDGLFNLCSSLTTIPTYNTVKAVNFDFMFAYCTSLTTVPALNASAGTGFGGMFNGCGPSITSIRMYSVKRQITISNLGLSAYYLNMFFGNLGPPEDPSGSHVWCSGNPGSSTCSPSRAPAGWGIWP